MRAPKGEGALAIDELEGFTTGLVALAGRPVLDARHHGVGGLLDRLVGLFGRDHVCVELQRHLLRDEECDNEALTELARAYRVPVIATNGVRFATPGERPLFDVLSCIYHHTTLDAAGTLLRATPSAISIARGDGRSLLGSSRRARRHHRAGRAARVLDGRSRLSLSQLSGPARRDRDVVPAPHRRGRRARSLSPVLRQGSRADRRELDLIEKLDLAGYFLIVWDIVNYCRQQDILVQGRGSAANSAVCYSLGITAVDPIEMELLFERFLSEERGEWPDIDLDLPSGDRRERVIQHVYEKYGRLGAAMTANVITYRGRSAAREVGKALSLNDEQIDRLAKVMHHFEYRDPNETLARNMEITGLSMEAPRMQMFAELWRSIQDLPRHLGQHSGGMVVCQGQLDSVVPLEPASMPDRVVIQWDKDDCADMGIVKVDLLGLGMMAVLQDAIEMVNTGIGDQGSGSRTTKVEERL
jgi:error-prone DNA polymerase